MKKSGFIQRMASIGAMLMLLQGFAVAHTTILVDSSFYSKYPYVCFVFDTELTQMTDEEFFAKAAKVGFAINETKPLSDDPFLAELRDKVLPRINEDSLELAYMVVRGAASPDGPYENNKMLGDRRARWLFDFIQQQLRFPVDEEIFHLDSEAEDYRTLCLLMQQARDRDYNTVKKLCDTYLPTGDIATLKTAIKQYRGGFLWKRLIRTYFHHLRTARIVLYFKKHEDKKLEIDNIAEQVTITQPKEEPQIPVVEERPVVIETPQPVVASDTIDRRELLAIKTNLLFYGVYMPGYDRWCPIPNVALEYFPKKGHVTIGASFDMPWWQDYDAHKYFQVRQYQVEGRYYLRANRTNEANESYKTYESHKTHKSYRSYRSHRAAYTGFYLQAYANAGVYGICFDADRGWVGSGFGGGIGLGYVMPLSRNEHWRLEFSLQAGYFTTKYDPYQYENPVDPTYSDGLYYYKWTLSPSLFKERQYRWNWLGPTRVGITLSYDLLYRRKAKRGFSFRAHEPQKGGAHE